MAILTRKWLKNDKKTKVVQAHMELVRKMKGEIDRLNLLNPIAYTYIINIFFKMREERKWTWRSLDYNTRNKIDFIIVIRKHMIQDVTVLNKCTVGGDHRMVRANIKSNRVHYMRGKTQKIFTHLGLTYSSSRYRSHLLILSERFHLLCLKQLSNF